MKLALVLGVQGEKVKPRLLSVKDNLKIDCYKSIPEFIDASIKRELIYDRILLTSKMINKSTLEDLHTFWSSYCKQTNVVIVCKKNAEEKLAMEIQEVFVSTSVAVMLAESTTVKTMAEGTLLSPKELNERYGISDYLSLETDEGFEFNAPEPEPEKVEEKKEPVKEVEVVEQKKEKKTILGALFGKKSKSSKGVATEEQADTNVSTYSEPVNEEISKDEVQEDLVDEQESDSEFDFEPVESETSETVEEVEDIEENEIVEEADETNEYDSSEVEEENFEDEVVEENFEENVESPVLTDEHEIENDFEPDEVDMDFGDSVFTTNTEVPKKKPEFNYEKEEVNDDFFSEDDLSSAEEQYRSQVEQPKVVTKVIEKEVVRHVGGTINTALSGVLNGKTYKTIIVTGDRGSGVTLAAYNIATKFAEKVPVLYYDCDVERHGLLSYIDYDTFRTYDESQRDAINRCRNSRAFKSCVCNFDINFDLLTTDYSFDVKDEAIELSQTVVAENQMNYSVVVVDCPIDKLHLISDLVLTGNVVICMEGTKRGVMNMLCSVEASPLPLRYKRSIIARGTMFLTKMNSKVKPEQVFAYGNNIFEAEDCNWLSMNYKVFNGKLSKDILESIVEG